RTSSTPTAPRGTGGVWPPGGNAAPPSPQESGDDEYRGDQSDSDDEVDSDFDIDEGEEPASDQDESEPKRRRRVVTKAYREPLKSLRPKKTDVPAGGSQKPREVKSLPLELQDDVGDSRKHMRQSTTEHTRQTFLRIQERQVQSKRKKGGPNYDRPLTQEELLEEAKITEEINLRSLGEPGAAGFPKSPPLLPTKPPRTPHPRAPPAQWDPNTTPWHEGALQAVG
uniref:Vacuolar protein sorting 72 homolog n=1 Tax=Calidris pygmaea TaxID=425635 RepID=A0A8C3PH53_9CHAR